MSSDLAFAIQKNRFFLFVIVLSCSVLCISFSAEYIFNKLPCYLCKLERLPYFGMLLVGLMGFSNIGKRIPFLILAAVCFISLLLGAYHFGVQQNIFHDQCKIASVATLENFKDLLHSPSCAKIELSIFGIPAPLLNFIISASLLFFNIAALKTLGKRDAQKIRLI